MTDHAVRRLRRLTGPSGRRIVVNWPAELRFQRMRRACVVLNLSCAGASIRAEHVPEGVSDVKLILESGPPIAASLAWRTRGRIGLRFRIEQEWLADASTRRYDPTAWVR